MASARKEEEAEDDEDGEEVVDSDARPVTDATTLGGSAHDADQDFEKRLQELKKYRDEHGKTSSWSSRALGRLSCNTTHDS